MLEAILVVSLFTVILKAIDYPFKKSLKETENLNAAVSLRKKIKIIKISFWIIFIILYLVVLPIYIAHINGKSFSDYWVADSFKHLAIIVYTTWYALKNIAHVTAPISTKKLSPGQIDTLQKPFVLYLREFEIDDYSTSHDETASIGNKFRENFLKNALNGNIEMYAIGKLNELESPEGATRLYVDDKDRQCCVKELMEAAEYIVILVSDSKNSIWEMEQSVSMIDKTIFVVDDYEQYEKAKENLKGKLDLPCLGEEYRNIPCYIRVNDNESERFIISPLAYNKLALILTRSFTMSVQLNQCLVAYFWFGLIASVFLVPYFLRKPIVTFLKGNNIISQGEAYLSYSVPTNAFEIVILILLIVAFVFTYWELLHIKRLGLILLFAIPVILCLASLYNGVNPGFLYGVFFYMIFNSLMLLFQHNKISGWKAFLSSR